MAIKEGSVVRGKVTGIQPYGVFVKLKDNMNGLIHISELTDSFVKDINDYVKIGQIIRVKVLEVDERNNQAKLSLKQANNYYAKFQERRKSRYIEETPSGFTNLENMLEHILNKSGGK